ncbi:unnamed protein product [Adineta steineri]|uniref:Uncharacterized protein n=1 Tax=Adineta steineri TaxID=433720 RepID=A0A819TCN6_9BILA|nr:unnamed protein product [Adineta steineri]CAF4070767.1 unnamed protein product [Adineta steineri]
MQHLLAQGPCIGNRTKRNNDNQASSTNHIYALQTTISDHRKIVFYLMNNMIKVTELEQHYAEQLGKIEPIWKSWRDISLLLLMVICMEIPVYFVISRIRLLGALALHKKPNATMNG